MLAVSSQCFAIAQADRAGTLSLIEREGRFGSFVAICDDRGTIEVADTRAEADKRIRDLRERALRDGDADRYNDYDALLRARAA